ncbi:hypothetical protein KP803_15920 [Vibrio sp. ZSDE26]|uniref:Porin domain-containing protein n=1 Tax=Vibrio amylolyticus TaxID=2847292 RepID=A0A9X1XM23_9VIBR|nr:hypothetical protein [Vibrio amylolyticus]MCK6264765.1 hypothetical protein [Vibrio amylolyticus]
MCNRYLSYCFLLYCSLYFSSSWANDVHISGFGTLAYSYESEDNIGFRRDLSQPFDSTTNGSWVSDSRFGLQLDYSLNTEWRTTIQAVAKDRVSSDWGDVFEIGFIGYQPSEHWDFRLGRLPADAFWATETRNIDYGHNWVRPPLEIYSWLPFQSVDGLDVMYHLYHSEIDWYFSSQIGLFRTSVETPIGEKIDTSGTKLVSLTIKALWDDWRARGSIIYSPGITTDVSPSNQQITTQLDAITLMRINGVSQEAQSLAQALVVEDEAMLYTQLGIEYFNGRWLLSGEVVSIHSESEQVVVPSGIGGYLSLSYYINDWSPYLIVSIFDPNVNPQAALVDWNTVSPELGYLQQQLIENINLSRIEQHTWSIGVRWDVAKNTALKAQVDFVEIAPNGYGLWANDISLNSTKTQLELYTLSLNFVF